MIRIVVVLPAPLRPTNPNMLPAGTEKLEVIDRDELTERPSKAVKLKTSTSHGLSLPATTRALIRDPVQADSGIVCRPAPGSHAEQRTGLGRG